MSESPQKPKRKRRRLSYSLRTLLVVITIFCVALGYWVHRANRQKAVVKWVEENGGSVGYDFETSVNGYIIDDAKPPGPEWVRAFLGDDYLATVIKVNLQIYGLKDRELKDVEPLAKLERLKYLTLYNTRVSDMKPLAKLTSLRILRLFDTQVTQEQLDELHKALPNCTIAWSPADKATQEK